MSANVNKTILIGRIVKDLELKQTNSGMAVLEFPLAINRKRKDASGNFVEESTFVDITLWGKNAENVSKFLGKGSSIYVEGELKQDKWVDKESGQNRSKLGVVGNVVQFLDGKADGGAPAAKKQAATSAPAPAAGGGDFGEDIPF